MTRVSVYDAKYDNAERAKIRAEEALENGDLERADRFISDISSHAQEFRIAADTLEEWHEELSNRHFDLEVTHQAKPSEVEEER